MDFQDGVGVVIVIGKKNLDLKVLKGLIDLIIFLFQQLEKFRIVVPVELIELTENAFHAFFTLFVSVLQILEPVGLLNDRLGFLLIGPEVFGCLLIFQSSDLVVDLSQVKESRLNLLTSLRKCSGLVSFHKFPYLLFLYDNFKFITEIDNVVRNRIHHILKEFIALFHIRL